MNKKKLDMVIPGDVVTTDLVKELSNEVKLSKDKPFTRFDKLTRFDKPDGVEFINKVSRENCIMICCKDVESARKLRTELIKSLELLNYYIDQVEQTGEIRYVR